MPPIAIVGINQSHAFWLDLNRTVDKNLAIQRADFVAGELGGRGGDGSLCSSCAKIGNAELRRR